MPSIRGFAVVACGLALAAMTLFARQPPSGQAAPLDPRRVAVAALSNETGDTRLAPLGPVDSRGSSERVADELSRAVAGAVDTLITQRDRNPP